MSTLNSNTFQVRVSSVLNREVSTCGKQFMFDGEEETSWCSDQGIPQWIVLTFEKPVRLDSMQIQFQGGFVGKDCISTIKRSNTEDVHIDFYPEDNNKLQTFNLDSCSCDKLKITFNSSTDFFGRIVIYKLNLTGSLISD